MDDATSIVLTVRFTRIFHDDAGSVVIATILGMYRTFEKAGEPGIACIVPIWNLAVMCRIAGTPTIWLLMMFIPLLNIIAFASVCLGIADNFHKSKAFGIGMLFLSPLFFCILGFGKAEYHKEKKFV